ncbi:MAG: hypothetical protein D3X82_11130 [Candidatus Leucobacter sulfamidivorax]|nr:hypothetical protein [Candidatus Leucobacter sulfamidivorax]
MAVRFLPEREAPENVPERDRGDLAEVIDLRSRLTRAPEQAAIERSASGRGSADQSAAEQSAADSQGAAEADGGPARTAAEDGVRLLARKSRSSGELRRELSALGHDTPDVEAVLLEFEGNLYLDDLGLARVLAEGLRERKRASRAQIRAKLRERLLPDGVIETVLVELDDEQEDELLRAAAEERARRLRGLDRQTAERRLLGFLARRGWSGEPAIRACREALAGIDPTGERARVRFE